MIPKLLCWLFGHIIRAKTFTGVYAKEKYINPITGIPMAVPIMQWEKLKYCPRCGASLEKKEEGDEITS